MTTRELIDAIKDATPEELAELRLLAAMLVMPDRYIPPSPPYPWPGYPWGISAAHCRIPTAQTWLATTDGN
jgi:hypothetical protein